MLLSAKKTVKNDDLRLGRLGIHLKIVPTILQHQFCASEIFNSHYIFTTVKF